MLTFILLVVLGGGVGLLAVSLAESGKPATVAGQRRRGDPPATPTSGDEAAPEASPEPAVADASEPEPEPAAEPPPVVAAVFEPAVVEEGHEPAPVAVLAPPQPRRVRRPEDVPPAFTAIEGRYADVARVPVWRRGLAVVGIVVITVAGGVLVAVVLGAAFATAAEVLDSTIE